MHERSQKKQKQKHSKKEDYYGKNALKDKKKKIFKLL